MSEEQTPQGGEQAPVQGYTAELIAPYFEKLTDVEKTVVLPRFLAICTTLHTGTHQEQLRDAHICLDTIVNVMNQAKTAQYGSLMTGILNFMHDDLNTWKEQSIFHGTRPMRLFNGVTPLALFMKSMILLAPKGTRKKIGSELNATHGFAVLKAEHQSAVKSITAKKA